MSFYFLFKDKLNIFTSYLNWLEIKFCSLIDKFKRCEPNKYPNIQIRIFLFGIKPTSMIYNMYFCTNRHTYDWTI